MTDIMIVPYTPEAEHFVTDSFVKSFQAAAVRVPTHLATPAQLAARERVAFLYQYCQHMLAGSTTLLAVAAESPSAYIGWVSASGDTLRYVYVKHAARKLGIATDLIRAAGPLMSQDIHTWPWTRGMVHPLTPFLTKDV